MPTHDFERLDVLTGEVGKGDLLLVQVVNRLIFPVLTFFGAVWTRFVSFFRVV